MSPNKVYMEEALLIIFKNSMVDHMVDYILVTTGHFMGDREGDQFDSETIGVLSIP